MGYPDGHGETTLNLTPNLRSTVGITEIQCPQCGTDVRMGLPAGSVVKSVTAADQPETDGPRQKARPIACDNGHECFVLFEW